jgi:beta-aspartyl-peptidase (threonine type)
MWTLILHGGASEIPPEKEQAFRAGCLVALEHGASVLRNGGTAVDAVEAAVRSLEDDPTFNAGLGSALNEDGEVEMCAAVMEGTGFNVGAVSIISGVRHPVSVARAMLYEEPILLSGDGALHFAEEKHLEICDPSALVTEHREADKYDTVGAIAMDDRLRIAVATSTGGIDGKPKGRVGDSPQPGCGFYVDDAIGAVAFSGDGEHIARKILAARVMHALPDASPERAIWEALSQVKSIGGEAGGIAISARGELGWAHNSPDFAVAYAGSALAEPHVYLRKSEERANGHEVEKITRWQ